MDHVQSLELFGPGLGFGEFAFVLFDYLLPFVDGEVEVFGLGLGLALGDEEEGEDATASEKEGQYLDNDFSCYGV